MPPLISFLFFTALVGVVTWILTRRDDHRSSTGYFLAGRSLTGGFIAGSLLLTNLSTEQLVGLNGTAYSDGISVMAWEVLASFSLVMLALVFLPRYLKSGIATIPQFLEDRFDAGTRNLTTLIFLFSYVAITMPIILYTGATGLSKILDVQALTGLQSETAVLWLTVWLIGIIGSIYAIFGGLRTVAVSDTLNGFGLLTGGLLITWYGLLAVNPAGVWPALETLQTEHPEKFNSLGGWHQSVPWQTLFTGVILLHLFYWTTNQQIIQRALGAKSLAEGQRGVLLAGIFKIFGPLILVLPGIIAFHLYHEEGLRPDHAYGHLVSRVLPRPLVGFFAAVLLGAVLSSFNSVLNSSATLFSLGVYKPLFNPQGTDEEVIHSGKWFGWVIAILAMCTAPLLANQQMVFDYMQKVNGINIPIFAVVVVGLSTRFVPAFAARCALVVGLLAFLAGSFVPPLAALVKRMHEFHFVAALFASLIVLMLGLGAIRPRSTPWQQRPTGEVDLTPWRFALPLSLLICAAIAGIYLWFADPSGIPVGPGVP